MRAGEALVAGHLAHEVVDHLGTEVVDHLDTEVVDHLDTEVVDHLGATEAVDHLGIIEAVPLVAIAVIGDHAVIVRTVRAGIITAMVMARMGIITATTMVRTGTGTYTIIMAPMVADTVDIARTMVGTPTMSYRLSQLTVSQLTRNR